MNSRLPWHDEAELLGVRVRAFFFAPGDVDARHDPVARWLPVLVAGGAPHVLPQPLHPDDGQRHSWRVGALVAQPDLVLRHGEGLICLLHRAGDGRTHERGFWRAQLRVDAMLQTIACAMAVAGECQRPTAALWRGANVLYQFDPSSPVLECLATHIGAARIYWNEPNTVTPAQLASFCEPRLRALPGLSAEPAAAGA